jgi:gliding motility-associated protein GldM
MQGDNFTAEVFVAAYDSKQQPEITLHGGKVDVKEGIGRFSIPATRPGTQSYSGRIIVRDPSGEEVPYDFRGEFVVQPPSATVSADKMNVVYVGLSNPLSISAPGVTSENIRPQATGGTLTPIGGGRYNFVPAQGAREAVVRGDALIGGELRNMGTQTFRVRPIPPPTAYIANRKEGRVTREELIAAGGIIPRLENFEFDYNYEIASFTFITIEGGDARRLISESNRLTPEMIQAIRNAGRDQVVTFMDIVTKPGPDGRPLRLGSISLNVQ